MKEETNQKNTTLPILNSDHEAHLKELFHVYSNLSTASGSRSNLAASSNSSLQDLAVDATRFVKFFKDQQLLNKHLTVTDLDIAFNRVKGPSKKDRKINYQDFKRALHSLALTRVHPDPTAPPEKAISADQAYLDLVLQIYNNRGVQPVFHATVPETSGVFSKLTDGSKHTASDAETLKKKASSQQNLLHSSSTSNMLRSPSKSFNHSGRNASQGSLLSSSGASKTALGTSEYVPTVPVIPKGSVFDRLTDTKGYTGTHKERFTEDGRGRGIEGRRQEDVGPVSLDKLVSRV